MDKNEKNGGYDVLKQEAEGIFLHDSFLDIIYMHCTL